MKIKEANSISPHNLAVYEAGKKLLIDTLDNTRDFCKHMITVSISSIPIYIGLLKLIIPVEYKMNVNQINMIILPTVAFFIASLIFTFGYFPQKNKFSLDIIEEITDARQQIIKRRYILIICGMIVYSFGILTSIYMCSDFFDIK